MRTHVNINFKGVYKIESMYEMTGVNVKVDPRSIFWFARVLSYIASILFTHVKTTIHGCGNPPLRTSAFTVVSLTWHHSSRFADGHSRATQY